MSLLQSIKRVFGFGDDYDDELGIDATVTPINAPQQVAEAEHEKEADNAEPCEIDEGQRVPADMIFQHVLDVFNQSLPDFLKSSVDVEAQKKYLYDTLDSSLKNYLQQLDENASREASSRWHNERSRLVSEIEALKERAKKADESETELRNRQLSSERQKRALAERLHDLENQIARLEAEHEQFELENKSLINKIRVNSIQEGDNEALKEEIASLKQQLSGAVATGNNLQTSAETEIDTSAIELLNEQIAGLNDSLDQSKARQELADAMIADLKNIASTARQELRDKELENQSLREQIASMESQSRQAADSACIASSEINELKEKLRVASEELANTREELAEANDKLSVIDEIQTQIDRFEDIKARKDAKISELQTARTQLVERIRTLENECRSFKKSIERNLMSQAKTEADLRDEIERLKSQIAQQAPTENSDDIVSEPAGEFGPVKAAKPRATRKKKQVKISAIDESLDNTDWLVATPPAGTSIRPSSKSDSDEFGYQAPTRKSPPENDAQMSLW